MVKHKVSKESYVHVDKAKNTKEILMYLQHLSKVIENNRYHS